MRQITMDVDISPSGEAVAVTGVGFLVVLAERNDRWNAIVRKDLKYGVMAPRFDRNGIDLYFSTGTVHKLTDGFAKLETIGDSRTLKENYMVAISQDGRLALDSNGLIDVQAGARLLTERIGEKLRFRAASRDAKWIVADQGTDPHPEVLLLSRDAEEIQLARRTKLPGEVSIMAASVTEDGSKVCLITTHGSVYVWSESSLEELTSFGGVEDSAWSANGRLLVIAGSYGLQLWDVNTSERISSSRERSLKHVAISADGSRIAVLSLLDEVHLFNAEEMKSILKVRVRDYVDTPEH